MDPAQPKRPKGSNALTMLFVFCVNFLFGALSIVLVGMSVYIGVGPWGGVFVGDAAVVLRVGYTVAAVTLVMSFVGMVCILYRASCALTFYLGLLVLVVTLQASGIGAGYYMMTTGSGSFDSHSAKLESALAVSAKNAINVGKCSLVDTNSTTNPTFKGVRCEHLHFDWFQSAMNAVLSEATTSDVAATCNISTAISSGDNSGDSSGDSTSALSCVARAALFKLLRQYTSLLLAVGVAILALQIMLVV